MAVVSRTIQNLKESKTAYPAPTVIATGPPSHPFTIPVKHKIHPSDKNVSEA